MLPFITSAAHSGVAQPRTAPEWSDLFLFVAAALAVWFVRRSLRKRFTGKRRDG